MVLNDAIGRDAHKLGCLQFGYVVCAAVSHTRTKASYELVNGFLQRSLVWNPSDYAFRNKFLGLGFT